MTDENSLLKTAPDLRIAILGNVDSGKTTLVGVLTKHVKDDGRGFARSHILQHKHEKEKGQTSAVALELLGFDHEGNEVIPHKLSGKHTKDFREVALRSEKLITIIDLCGHEHFLKTTVYGLMGMVPDMVFLLVGANAGVQKMTREHLGLAAALHLPVAVIVTKIDMAPSQILEDSLNRVDRVLRVAGRKKFAIKSMEDAEDAGQAMISGNIAPVFQLSSMTGEGLDFLRMFLRTLVVRGELAGSGIRESGLDLPSLSEEECEIQIDNTYNVPGVGPVCSGSVFHGNVFVGMHMHLGPDELGEFREVRVTSIHRQCLSVERVFLGQQCTVAIKAVSQKQSLKKIRTGQVLLSTLRMERLRKQHRGIVATFRFEASIRVLHHTTTIQLGYAPIVHLGTVRQSAVIESITFDQDAKVEDQVLRTGSMALVGFRFAYRPEFVTVGRPLVFREGTTKGVGKVTRLF